MRGIFLLLLCTTVFCSPTKQSQEDREKMREERRVARKGHAAGACSKEVCAKARSTLKVSGDCVKAPFCVRALVKDLKKAAKEKLRLLKETGKQRCGNVSLDQEPRSQGYSGVIKPGTKPTLQAMGAQIDSLVSQNRNVLARNQELGGEKRKLSGEAKLLQAKISGLNSQVKDLSLQNSQLERQVETLTEKARDGAGSQLEVDELEKQVEISQEEAAKWKERNTEVVSSLERVETQYAMMGGKLTEAVKAMSAIQNKVERMKKDLERKILEKVQLDSDKAELTSELQVCSSRLSSLAEVNSSCKQKIGELGVCKREIGRLATVVEERFSLVTKNNEETVQLKVRVRNLEAELDEASAELSSVLGQLEGCDMKERVQQARAGELAQKVKETETELIQKKLDLDEARRSLEEEKLLVEEERERVEELEKKVIEIEDDMVEASSELDEMKSKLARSEENEAGKDCNSPCMISRETSEDLIEMSKKTQQQEEEEEKYNSTEDLEDTTTTDLEETTKDFLEETTTESF